jgi:hypothetical protein
LLNIKTGEKEKLDRKFRFINQQSRQHPRLDCMNGVPQIVFDLMKAEMLYEDSPNPPFKKRTRKKRKRRGCLCKAPIVQKILGELNSKKYPRFTKCLTC